MALNLKRAEIRAIQAEQALDGHRAALRANYGTTTFLSDTLMTDSSVAPKQPVTKANEQRQPSGQLSVGASERVRRALDVGTRPPEVHVTDCRRCRRSRRHYPLRLQRSGQDQE